MGIGFWIFFAAIIAASIGAFFTPRLSLATLLKIGGLVILVPALLAAVSFLSKPTLEQATRAPCVNNLLRIDSAKEQWTLENKAVAGKPVDESQVDTFIKGGRLQCPGHGIYKYGPVGEPPVCSLASHKLP